MKASGKLTTEVDGHLQFRSDPPLVVPVRGSGEPVGEQRAPHSAGSNIVQSYSRSLVSDRRHLVDQYRVRPHGAQGRRRGQRRHAAPGCLLFVGRDNTDPLILQAKEAQASVLERFTSQERSSPTRGSGWCRGQRLMQAASDIFLGWDRSQGTRRRWTRDFYVRQLWDWKGVGRRDRNRPKWGLPSTARTCAWTLARAHARSGDRLAIAAYLGSGPVFAEAIAAFSELYADQSRRDFEALKEAVASGRVTAETGI